MRGILINPFDEIIKVVVLTGNYKEIYALIECRTFDCVDIDEYNTMYIDDEGLLKEPNRYFSIQGRNYAGSGLIIGNNDEGESIDSTLTVEQIKDMISFLPKGYKQKPFFSFHEL